MTKRICVFCSSSDAVEDVYFQEARLLGQLIATNSCELVYGGANVGLMHQVASSVQQYGGRVVGVVPEKIVENGIASKGADELIVTSDMKERKAMMRKLSHAYVALPGGFGTLEEVLEVITLKQLGYHCLPIVFVDVNGFFSALIQQFEKCFQQKFAKSDYRKMYHVASNSQEAWEYIRDYKDEGIVSKWF